MRTFCSLLLLLVGLVELAAAQPTVAIADGRQLPRAARLADADTDTDVFMVLWAMPCFSSTSGCVEAGSVSNPFNVVFASPQTIRLHDGAGNALTSILTGAQRPLTVAIVDAAGNQITSFVGSGGSAQTDDAAYTVGSASFTAVGGTFRSTLDTVNDGDAGALAMLDNRILMVNLRDASGSEVTPSGGTQFDEDTLHVSGDKLTLAGVVRRDTPSSGVSADGERAALGISSAGRLWGSVAVDTALPAGNNNIGDVDVATLPALAAGSNNIGDVDVLTVITGTGATNLGKAEDAAHTTADTGVAALFVRCDTAASTSGTTGDYTVPCLDDAGRVRVNPFGVTQSASNYLTVRLSDSTNFLTASQDATHDAAALTAGPQLMGEFDDTSTDLVDEGDAGKLRIDARRNLYGVIRDGAGNERSAFVDANNALQVVCPTCSAGAAKVDDVAYSIASDSVSPVGYLLDDTATDSVNEGDVGLARMSANRVAYGILRDAAGNERGANVTAGNRLTTSATIDAAIPAGTNNIGDVDVLTLPGVAGDIAHDAADSGNPLKVGHKAIAHGTNPTAVAAGDRTDSYANRAGVPFVIGGHPNIITLEAQVEDADGAQTNAALVTVGAGAKIVVTRASMKCDGSTTGPTNAVIGFGTATLPARAHTGVAGIVAAFDGIPAGGGSVEGSGAGILGIGADNEDLRLTMEDPAGGACSVTVSYYTIES